MKTARRHELQTNELADRLAKGIEGVKPYSRLIVGSLVLAIVLLVAITWWTSSSQRHAEEGWQEYLQASGTLDRDRLEEVGKQYAGTTAAAWSRLALGDMLLSQGLEQLFGERAEGKTNLRKAVEHYRAALDELDPAGRQQALYGIGRAYEGLGELDKAKEQFQAAANLLPEGPFTVAARDRVADLNKTRTKKFYDSFAKYEPRSPILDEPGTPGVRPSGELPDELTPFKSLGKPDERLDPSKSSVPGANDIKPSDLRLEQPSVTDPAAGKPGDANAGDEKPAEAPAAETPAEKPAGETLEAEKPAEPAPSSSPSPSSDAQPEAAAEGKK
jgi:tetratricopeptide (TPR) repeat protein